MTSNDGSPEIKNTESHLGQTLFWSLLGAILGGVLVYMALKPSDDPDRPPIIVRNGSVIIEERQSGTRGELKKDPTRRTWYHEHAHPGPQRLNAFVVGVANNSCGSGGTNFVSNVRKLTVSYSLGEEIREIEILNRGNRVEIDVNSGPDPTNVDAWTLSFDAEGARLTKVSIATPGGTETCELDAGARIWITQHR